MPAPSKPPQTFTRLFTPSAAPDVNQAVSDVYDKLSSVKAELNQLTGITGKIPYLRPNSTTGYLTLVNGRITAST